MRALLWIISITGVLSAGIYFGAKWWHNRDAASREGKVVRVEPATRGSLVETINASGEVEPKRKVSISARVAARITDLPFKEGDRVTKGDPGANPPIAPSVLVRLDATDLEAALKSAEARRAAQFAQIDVSKKQIDANAARIEAAKATLAEVARDLRRQKELLASKDVSESIVDQAQSKVDEQTAQIAALERSSKADELSLLVQEHNLDAADAEIARARDGLSYTVITSPIDGVVTRLNAEVGELVVTGTMNNAGTIIMEVADLSEMLLKARVDETAIADVHTGQKAKIRMEAYRDQVFSGTVTSVALANFDQSQSRGSNSFRQMSSSDGSRFFKVEILLDTQGKRIFSGLTADADIETKRFEDVVKVPIQAVVGRPIDSLPTELRDKPEVDKSKSTVPVVYCYKDGKAVATPVTIGSSDLTHTQVTAGLQAGDIVITGPYKVLESIQHNEQIKSDRSDTASRPPVSNVAAGTPATQPAS